MTGPTPAAGRPGRWSGRALQLGLACLALYLLSPALTAGHVEGFSAQIESLALLLWQQGSVAGHDVARPLVSEFIFFTRAGVVDLLAAAHALFGWQGDTGFRVLTVASLAVLLLASAAVARQQARVPFWTGVFVCVLAPGIAELGFFFNDNLVSAAFAAVALAAAGSCGGTVGALLAGLAIGCAVLCRIDAALAAPCVAAVLLMRQRAWGSGAARMLLLAAAALAVHLVAARINGGDLRDALRVTGRLIGQHLGGHGRLPGKFALLYFFGAIVPVLMLIGARFEWRQRPAGWRGGLWVAAFYGYPLLLMIYVLLKTLEIRYFLPLLAPLVALHAGRGWQVVAHWLRQGSPAQRMRGLLLAVAGLALLVAPPMLPLMRDGPRLLVGRLWSPALWRDWQAVVSRGMAVTTAVADRLAAAPVATVVSTHWNDEFYLRLRLFEAGYREVPAGPDCRPLSLYRKGEHTVWHVRLQPQYQLPPFDMRTAMALPLSAVRGCRALHDSAAAWVTTFGPPVPELVANGLRESDFAGPLEVVLARTLDDRLDHRPQPELRYPLMAAAPLPIARLDQLSDAAAAHVAAETAAAGAGSGNPMDRYEASFRAR